MAISFPSNPTTNQVYTYGSQSWIYNGSVWVQNILAGALIQVQNTAPTTAQVGTLWWDSDSGDFSVYYNSTWAGMTAAGVYDNAITTTKILDGSVTTSKIANYAVTSQQIANNTITSSQLAAGAAIPTQTGNSGKYLTTDGTNASWGTVNTTPGAGTITSSMLATSIAIDTLSVTGNASVSVPIKNSSGRPILNQSGSVLQVVQSVITAASTVTGPNGTATLVTGLSATITPSSTSSKILVNMQLNYCSTGTTYGCWFKRNGTDIGLGDAGSGQQRVSVGMALSTDANQINSFTYNYLDNPATTSALTYQLYVNNDNTNALYINRSVNDYANSTGKRTISTITLTEISG